MSLLLFIILFLLLVWTLVPDPSQPQSPRSPYEDG